MPHSLWFPPGFLWGSATSAYQTEGGIENSDWSVFSSAGNASGHYRFFEEDFQLLSKMSHSAYRFSIEWSRVEPREGVFDKREIAHYRKVLESLLEKRITPMVTLHHFTTPLWLAEKGGWANGKIAGYFAEFAGRMAEEYGDIVKFWITINEPLNYAFLGYVVGRWVPGRRNPFLFLRVLKNQIKAHKEARKAMRSANKGSLAGIAQNIVYVEPFSSAPWDGALASTFRFFQNRWLLDRLKDSLDFIGVNYYFHSRIRFPGFSANENKILSDVGWEVYPEGIYRAVKEVSRYGLPVYITENGVADAKDAIRKNFIQEHLRWLHRAIREGADVRGYFYWSFLDNFEWEKGFVPRFGLVKVDYASGKRIPRASADFYAAICRKNKITAP